MGFLSRLPSSGMQDYCKFITPGLTKPDISYFTDQGRSKVIFGWESSGASSLHGEFTEATGALEYTADIEDSCVSFVIKTASVSTGFETLDKQLRSADFLEVENYPYMTFNSTKMEKTGDTTLDIHGELTLHGVTNPIMLKADMTYLTKHPLGKGDDFYKGRWIAFKANTKIDNQAFDVACISSGRLAIEINAELKAK